MPKGNTPYPNEIDAILWNTYELSGMHGNFEGNRQLTLDEVKAVSELISCVDGRTKVYDQWLCPSTKGWRLTLGYDK